MSHGKIATMLKGFKLIAIIAAGVAVVVALLAFVTGREKTLAIIFGSPDLSPVDFRTLQLTPKPNQFLVCPPNYCAAAAHMVSPVFDGAVGDLRRRWAAMLAKQPRIATGAADEGALQFDYIQRSEVVRYPDSITVRFLPLEGGHATLAIYSRSHYGRSDFGVNEARIRAWLAAL